jgi:cobalamin biosynthetic protein CobC
VARHALEDLAWQAKTREKLVASSRRLEQLLAPLGEVSRTALFCTLKSEQIAELAEHFAQRAILTRQFEQHGLVRFGLPGSEGAWQRLAQAVSEWNK